MKKIVFVMLGLLPVAGLCQGQGVGAVPPNIRAVNTLERLRFIRPTDMEYGIPMPPKQLIGDGYLDSHWKPASMLLYGTEKLLEGYPSRYDLIAEEMEIKSTSGVKVLNGKKIKSFVWIDSVSRTPEYYVNASDYRNSEDVPFDGFFQILADGKMPLLKRTKATIKKATYTEQFDVGSKDDQIIKKSKLYYATPDGKAAPVPSSKKKFFPLMGDKQPQVESFIRENRLLLSEEQHLKKIFEYYNSLN